MLGSLWAYGGASGPLWATLGLLWSRFQHIVGESGSHFWRMKVALGSILGIKVVKDRYMRVTLGSCWGHFGHMEVLLGCFGSLWGYFVGTLRSLWGNMGVTFGV